MTTVRWLVEDEDGELVVVETRRDPHRFEPAFEQVETPAGARMRYLGPRCANCGAAPIAPSFVSPKQDSRRTHGPVGPKACAAPRGRRVSGPVAAPQGALALGDEETLT